jgi:hypothetical protein
MGKRRKQVDLKVPDGVVVGPFSYVLDGAAAAAIDSDKGPTHAPLVRSATTARYEVAADPNCEADPSQAAAAGTSDPDPAPAYIRPELISGGNAPKSTAITPAPAWPRWRAFLKKT